MLAVGFFAVIGMVGYAATNDDVIEEGSVEVAPAEDIVPIELDVDMGLVIVEDAGVPDTGVSIPEDAGVVLASIASSGHQRAPRRRVDLTVISPAQMRAGFFGNRTDIHNPEAVALMLARMCVSEEGWRAIGCPATWQVVENVRGRNCDVPDITECVDGQETHMSAMRRLSPRVTGQRDPLTQRTRAIASLEDSDAMPSGWLECVRPGMPRSCNGTWSRFVPLWQRARARARSIIQDRNIVACPAPVIAWGGRMDDDNMERRNLNRQRIGQQPLVRVQCSNVANRYYAHASRVGAGIRMATPGVDFSTQDPEEEAEEEAQEAEPAAEEPEAPESEEPTTGTPEEVATVEEEPVTESEPDCESCPLHEDEPKDTETEPEAASIQQG